MKNPEMRRAFLAGPHAFQRTKDRGVSGNDAFSGDLARICKTCCNCLAHILSRLNKMSSTTAAAIRHLLSCS